MFGLSKSEVESPEIQDNPSAEPAVENAGAAAEDPADTNPKTTEEPEAAPASNALNYEQWIKETVIDFLDIADLPSQHDRRAALVSMKLTEKQFHDLFSLAEALMTIKYAFACVCENAEDIQVVELYRGKAALLKEQMGISK